MAYIGQEKKAEISPAIKAICAKYKIKATIAIQNSMTLCLNIKSGAIDFFESVSRVTGKEIGTHMQVNPYWYQEHFDGDALAFLSEVIAAMKIGNWDRSDIQSDYFDVGWYVDVNIGKWDKPYVLTK